jgi:hypothetical protein
LLHPNEYNHLDRAIEKKNEKVEGSLAIALSAGSNIIPA